MKRVLALDLGTHCGFALAGGAGLISAYGTWDLRTGRFSGGGMRFVRFKKFLNEIGPSTVDMVVFEEVRRHRGTDAAHVYGGLLATLTAWCEENKIPYEGYTVQAIKKYATGKGGGPGTDKDAMMVWARTAGYNPDTDNAADALALLRLVLSDEVENEHRAGTVPIPSDRLAVALE